MVTTAWLRRTVSYGLASTMTLFGLTGIASAQTITNTGPGSRNQISSSYTNNCQVVNNNNVSAQNSNNQTATTGTVNESGNTTAGLSWSGWSALNPATAQANGIGYGSWWSGVVNWVGQRASGAGWNSNQSNLSYTANGNNWSGYDPMTWQTNGQSFGNWYNAVESYLNSNSSAWVLGWPSTATGSGSFGSMSGSATNNYNANFSININNAARAASGTNSCGQSNFTPPPTGGMGGGPTGSMPTSGGGGYVAPTGGRGAGSYGGGSGAYYGGGSGYTAPVSHGSGSAPVTPSAPSTPSAPTGGSGGGAPSAPTSTISNTGPGSTNTVSSSYTDNSKVTNNNNVSVSSSNTQTASTGSSNTSGNTTAGGGGSGNASNGNGSGTGVGITN